MMEIEIADKLFFVTLILFFILLTPLIFIGFDFWAGNRKARQRGEPIISDKWQRTVQKVAKYYNALLALVVVDAMQMASIWYLQQFYGWRVPIFPLVTLLGAMGVAAIEIKSIFESAEEKEKREIKKVALLVSRIVARKGDPDEVASALTDYFTDKTKSE